MRAAILLSLLLVGCDSNSDTFRKTSLEMIDNCESGDIAMTVTVSTWSNAASITCTSVDKDDLRRELEKM